MGFKNSYSHFYKGNDVVPNEKCTILPFFGFSYEKKDGGHFESYGGGVTITDKGGGTYEAKQNPTYRSWKSTHEVVFSRACPPYGRLKELEDSFFEHIRTRDIFSTQYIPLSVKEYVTRHQMTAPENRGFLGCLPFLVFCCVAPILESRSHIDDSLLELLTPVGFAISLLLFFIIKHITKKTQKPYESLSADEKKKVREEYLAYMIKKYGKEAGGILQEYAKLKGYDRI